jgi:GNAT superfamily N-acetyltransferase|tara:strand:- start:643 stop:1209 length:567 start_codon:yes stop_codon:yes gene_type:complete
LVDSKNREVGIMGIIETLSTKHLAGCILISNDLLGVNYHDKVYFEKTIQQKQGIVLMLESKVVGFLIFKVTSPEYSNKMYGIDLNESVGHIGSVCVATSHQRKGFGSHLVEEVISILAREFSSIYTLAWKYNDIVNLEKILIKYKFNQINHLDFIWKEECENNAFNCPVKANLCICSGIVYKLDLNNN